MHLRRLVLGMFAIVGGSVGAGAQTTPAPVPIKYLSYVGLNPLGIPFDVATAEIETAVAPGVTLGGVGSYASVSGSRYTTADAKLRFYLGGVVLRGASFGATAGVTHYRHTPDTGPDGTQTLTAPTIGLIVDYNWLLGADRRFVVGTGAGLKRIIASDNDRGRVDLDPVLATARLIVGYAF